MPDTPSKRGQPKGDKRERTRTALLEAARQLIRERGFEHTTLQAVAERAGMTSGAIYGNFKDRSALFVALGQYWPAPQPKVRPGATLAERMEALAEALIAILPDRHDTAYGRLTGMAHALTVEEFRDQIREVTAASYAFGAAWLSEAGDLPLPADQYIVAVHALMEGLTFQRLVTPDLVPDTTIRAAFRALAGA